MGSEERLVLVQRSRYLESDTETPISLLLKLAPDGEAILLESAEVDGRWGRYSLLGCDMGFYAGCEGGCLKITVCDERFAPLGHHSGKPFLEGMKAVLGQLVIQGAEAELPPITRAIYGYLGFGMASIFNPHLQPVMPPAEATCQFALPTTLLVFDHLYNRLCQLTLGEFRDIPATMPRVDAGDDVAINAIEATPNGARYKEFVRGIREKLRQGEAIQVVPSVRFCAPFNGNPFTLYRRLRRFNASPYMFYMGFPHLTLLGASPEVMVRCTHNHLELSPIAGTRPRGKTEAEDGIMADELLADPKDRAEHVMLVDLGRNDLGSIARGGSVEVKAFMQIQRFSHVMHLTSDVHADLATATATGRPLDALDVLAATFPAGTVSGAPKFRAMEIIRELEGQNRGPYAGCIGWLGLDHDSVNLDMGITIRSMWVKDGRVCWQAGGGIVHDSDPESEWQEVCNKSAIMRLALNLEEMDNVPDHR